ncbi:MAG: flagellar hook-associated protein FlgK [Ramlibacter sp.]
MADTLLSIGSRALVAAQGAINTVSHNITNANTPGYSRQEAQLVTAGGLYTGAGFFGSGVQLATVRRQYDQFLTTAVQSATATSAADSTRADGLKSRDAVFGDSELGLGASLDAFFAAAGDLANRPADLSARQVFLARAQQLAARVDSVGTQVQQLAQSADNKLSLDATQVNTQLTTIHKLNDQIARWQGTGQPPNDLLDQRDSALQQLNGLLGVTAVAQDDGSISLFTTSGAALLVGSQQATLDAVADANDPSVHALRLTVGSTSQVLDATALGGGSLAGALHLRDGDYAAALNQVGRIATVVASAFNAQQALGVDAVGQPGTALFTLPAPSTRPTSGNSNGATLATAVSNPAALQGSDYQVSWNGSQYTVQRLSDGTSTTSATLPATVDGLTFSASGTPAAGDSWRVQPLRAAATGLAARPLTPRDVATAFAATIAPAAANQGSVVASGFGMVRAAPENATPVTITFNTPPTTFNVTGLASGNLTNVAYTPGQPVPASPADYNGWRVTLDGVPAAGDSFQVRPTTAPASDNRNALALGQLANQGLVGGSTLNEAYASLLGDVGNRVQSAQAAADVSTQLQNEAVTRQQNVAGVNLDEEAANLLRYQQAYQACAKIIQASQTLFQSLLSATGN